jgi:putative heme-binding domain-containing protein
VSGGNAAAGKKVFASQGCGSCHTDQAAGTNGNVGPNLTTGLKGKTPAFIQQSIVDPNAEVTEGYQPNIMPQTYGDQLSKKQLADLVAFLSPQ